MSDFPHKTGNASPEEHNDQSYDPTIVGGRPLSRGQLLKGIPRGIEVLIKKASVDPEFRAVLIEKRAEAAAEIELELSATEAAMLKVIEPVQLEKIIENAKVPDGHRRIFLGQIADAMLFVLGTTSSGGCAGIRPDWPPPSRKFTGHTTHFRENQPGTIAGTRVPEGREQLKITPKDKSPDKVDVAVECESPFDNALLSVLFRDYGGAEARRIEYHPTGILVAKGKRNVTVQCTGTSGETRWLEVTLTNRGDDLKNVENPDPPESHPYLPGEYVIENYSITRVIELHKTWKA
jgi:hypothetical protein